MDLKACDEKQSGAKLQDEEDTIARTKPHHHHHRADSKHHDTEDDDEKMLDDHHTDDDHSESSSSESDEDSDHHVDMTEIMSRLGPMSSRHRRSVVSSPITIDKQWTPPVYPKIPQEEASIRHSVRRNLLFEDIPEETLQILVYAMKFLSVPEGTEIIKQGDTGDLFYILDHGTCDVLIQGRVVGELDGTSNRNFFGELALLYDAPRAATIVTTSAVECWSLDRVTFKRILMATTIKQRQLHVAFIQQVPIFSTLSQYDQMIVADALRIEVYEEEQMIIQEGTQGDEFYIVEDGEVMCTQEGEEVSAHLGSGDFFGELALITNEKRLATVTAVRKTKCLVLGRKTFQRLLGPMQEHLRKRADLYQLYIQKRQHRVA